MGFDLEYLEDLEIQLIDGDRGKKYPKQHEFFDSGYCLFYRQKMLQN
jgi:type I restriction enzyme S subunit